LIERVEENFVATQSLICELILLLTVRVNAASAWFPPGSSTPQRAVRYPETKADLPAGVQNRTALADIAVFCSEKTARVSSSPWVSRLLAAPTAK
jgi:hypothetical protein